MCSVCRFNSLVEQIKDNRCRMAISILHISKSKVLRKWKELDDRVTDGANEAKDNIKVPLPSRNKDH